VPFEFTVSEVTTQPTRGVNMFTSVPTSREIIHPKQARERPGFWAVALLVAICLLMLTLTFHNEDFAQALQLYGQWP